MKFQISTKEIVKHKKGTQPYVIRTGIWIDNSKYPASKLIKLRKERGIGRVHKKDQRNCVSKTNY